MTTSISNRGILPLTLLLAALLLQQSAVGQHPRAENSLPAEADGLPAESVLPESWRPAESTSPSQPETSADSAASTRQDPTSLPAEAMLASEQFGPPASPQPAVPGNERPAAAEPPPLPAESTLPSDTKPPSSDATPSSADEEDTAEPAQAKAGEAAPANPDSELSPGEVRPWLRLRYDGHTGRVRALDLSADGNWLVSAGDDKELHVWSRDPQRGWIHRRVIRWQIERGPRGRIYAVALRGKIAAIAGHGAMGGLGEIWLVDIESGQLERPLVDIDQGHRQTIASLAWAPGDSPALASADVEGRVMVWRPDARSGLWTGKMIVNRDRETYGETIARALAPRRVFVPVIFSGPDHLIVPRYAGASKETAGEALWRLARWNVTTGKGKLLPKPEHREFVVDLTSTADGTELASLDAKGNVWLWQLADPAAGETSAHATQLPPQAGAGEAIALALDPKGQKLWAGTVGDSGEGGQVVCWDDIGGEPTVHAVEAPAAQQPILDLRWDAAHGEIVFASGIELRVHAVGPNSSIRGEPTQVLTTPIRPVQRVAFSRQPDQYRIALGYGGDLENTFDLHGMQIGREADIDEDQFRLSQQAGDRWTTRAERTEQGIRYRLYFGDQPRALLPLQTETHGVPTAVATLDQPREDESDRQAVIVGTSARNNIYVYDAPGEKTDESPRLLRQFRAHTGSVLSLGTSQDGRYLVSGAEDATVAVWPLADLFQLDTAENRWGIDFQVEDGELIAAAVRPDGPLHFRGVREGDRLVSLHWVEAGTTQAASEAADMLKTLTSVPFDTLLEFRWQRRGEPLAGFQSFSAWQPLARLFVDRDREWAVWTPAGVYDASMNGHQRFGWQINRGINRLPEFFRAAQFRARLERPDVMRQLLRKGSLAEALTLAGGAGLPPGDRALVNQYRVKPRIELLEPQPNALIEGDEAVVRAEIRVPLGGSLRPPKVFADGVPAGPGRRLSVRDEGNERIEAYRWEVPLVREREVTIEVIAATEAEAFDRVTTDIRRQLDAAPSGKPRLHLIAIGVSQYRDPQIQSLDFAARGAQTVHQLLARQTASLYNFSGATLVDDDAIRPLWNVYTREAADRLAARIEPDDLVVMYLCGHGLRDRRTDRWYFVTADARYADLMKDRYEDCLAFEDLAALTELPCRKLAILDSCHSGAVQPAMRCQDLKSALRWLQDDMILTLTASEGHQEAAEEKQQRLGRFTAHLVAALEGAADAQGDQDGIVSLHETIEYVRLAMQNESMQDGFVQRPTAAPIDLIRSIRMPLTVSKAR